MQANLQEQTIIESKPDNFVEDLRCAACQHHPRKPIPLLLSQALEADGTTGIGIAAHLTGRLACRFHKPWRELEEFAMSINLALADDILHKHTPYGEMLQDWMS